MTLLMNTIKQLTEKMFVILQFKPFQFPLLQLLLLLPFLPHLLLSPEENMQAKVVVSFYTTISKIFHRPDDRKACKLRSSKIH